MRTEIGLRGVNCARLNVFSGQNLNWWQLSASFLLELFGFNGRNDLNVLKNKGVEKR